MKKVFLILAGLLLAAALLLIAVETSNLQVDFGPEMCVNVFNAQTGCGYLMGYCSWIGQPAVWFWPW